MKYLAVLTLVLCGALPSAALRDDPPPPPVDCPMCGGNVELHQKRTKFLVRYQATLILRMLNDSAAPI
jgi:hypothetical protein